MQLAAMVAWITSASRSALVLTARFTVRASRKLMPRLFRIAPFSSLHRWIQQSIQHLTLKEPALLVGQPSHVQWADLLPVPEAAVQDPSVPQQMAFQPAVLKVHSVSTVDSMCVVDSAAATGSVAAYLLSAIMRSHVGVVALGPCLQKCWSHPFELGHA